MDENEQNNFGFDGSNLSEHEQALVNAVNQGKNLSQAKGSSSSLPSSVQRTKKPNFIGNMVSSFAKNASAFMRDDSGGSPMAMLERTGDTGSSIKSTTRPRVTSRIAGRAADASANVSDGVASLGGGNSSAVLTPFQRQELLIFNRIKDDISEIADLMKDLDGKPSTKGTTDLIKGTKEGKSKDSLLDKILAGLAGLVGIGALIAGAVSGAIKDFFSKFKWPKFKWPEFHWPEFHWPGSNGPHVPKPSRMPKFSNPFKKNPPYVPKHMAPSKPNILQRAFNKTKSTLSNTAKFVGKNVSKATKFVGKNVSKATKFAMRPVRFAAKLGGNLLKGIGKYTGINNALRVGKMAFGAGRVLGKALPDIGVIASTGLDEYDDYQQMQKHKKDSKFQLGEKINMGLDAIQGTAWLAAQHKVAPQITIPVAIAAGVAKNFNDGYMRGPTGRQNEAAVAKLENQWQDTQQRFQNLGKVRNKKANFWDPTFYGFGTLNEIRNSDVASLEHSGKKDKATLDRIKTLKNMQLAHANEYTYKDIDFNPLHDLQRHWKETFGGADSKPGQPTSKSNANQSIPAIQFPHIPALPSAQNILQSAEGMAQKAVTSITAPLTQTFSVIFNNTKVESESDVKKWVDQILRQEHQAADMAKRASERFSNLNNTTLNASKQIAIRPGSALA